MPQVTRLSILTLKPFQHTPFYLLTAGANHARCTSKTAQWSLMWTNCTEHDLVLQHMQKQGKHHIRNMQPQSQSALAYLFSFHSIFSRQSLTGRALEKSGKTRHTPISFICSCFFLLIWSLTSPIPCVPIFFGIKADAR